MAATNSHKNLIWDLGNTLLKIDMFTFARQLGLLDMALYPILNRTHPETLFHKTFDLLDRITVSEKSHQACHATAQGRQVPPVVCKWLSGDIPHEEVLTYLKTPLSEQVPDGFFKNKREERLVHTLLSTLTNPKAITSAVKIIKEGLDLLKKCAEQYDSQGHQRHSLYVLSNWDPYSFTHLKQAVHLQELFTYFKNSNLIISGDIGLVKPHDEIYTYIIKTHNLIPSECILIDDHVENIEGARKNGMKGILLKNGNYSHVRTELQRHNVL